MKRYLLNIATTFFLILTFPFYLIYLLNTIFWGKRRAFTYIMQLFSMIPGITGEWMRVSILKWITRLPLNQCCISFGTTFSDPKVIIEDGVYIGSGCDIGYAHIKKDTIIGSGVHILSGLSQHGFDSLDKPIKDQPGKYEKVTIGKDSWIGNGAVIGADIGEGCVIGAGAVVVRPITDYSIAVGNPARVIKNRKKV